MKAFIKISCASYHEQNANISTTTKRPQTSWRAIAEMRSHGSDEDGHLHGTELEVVDCFVNCTYLSSWSSHMKPSLCCSLPTASRVWHSQSPLCKFRAGASFIAAHNSMGLQGGNQRCDATWCRALSPKTLNRFLWPHLLSPQLSARSTEVKFTKPLWSRASGLWSRIDLWNHDDLASFIEWIYSVKNKS